MNESEYQNLVAQAQRRPLTTDEQARLRSWRAASPAAAARWTEDEALSHGLRVLPDAPLSPGFTRRVLAAIEQSESAPASARWRRWLPRWNWHWQTAVAGLVVTTLVVLQLQQRTRVRNEMAESLAHFSTLADVPELEALADFDAVYRLVSDPPPNASELAAALD